MKFQHLIIALTATALAGQIHAQVNEASSAGYQERARAMLQVGNYNGCLDQCDVALKLGSQNREALMRLSAVASYNAGYADARTRIQQYMRQFPMSPYMEQMKLMLASLTYFDGEYYSALMQFMSVNRLSLPINLAETLDLRTAFSGLKVGRDKPTEECLQRLLTSRDYSAAAKLYLGYIPYASGDLDVARQWFEQARSSQKAPGDMADYYLAQIDFKQRDYSKALMLAQSLMSRQDVEPEFKAEALRIAGECLFMLDREQQGLTLLKEYEAQNPDDLPLSSAYILGVDAYETGDYDRAIYLLSPVSELEDAMGQNATVTIGQSYMKEGNSKAALLAFEKATKNQFSQPVTEKAYYNYAVAQVDGGRIPFGNSVETLENFLELYSSSKYAPAVQNYLVKGYMATDDYEGALRSLNAVRGKESAQIQDARQQVNFVLGTRALQSGNAAEALEFLKEAEKYKSRNASISSQTELWLGDANYALGKYGEAEIDYRDYLKSASKNDPNVSLARYNLGYSLFAQRKYADARKEFETAQKGLSADAKIDAMNRIGDTYYYSSDFPSALKAYQEAYNLNPEVGDYSLLQQAMMQGHQRHNAEKLATLDKVINQYPSSSYRPVAMTEKALTQSAMGKTSDAIVTYQKVLETYPLTKQGRNAMLQLAILNDNAGNQTKAIEYYRQVIIRHPSSTEAQLAVQDLKRIYGDSGKIEELNSFLQSTKGAPQLDAMEVNAIAANSLLRKARNAKTAAERLEIADQLLDKYPDSEAAEEALLIAAKAEYDRGMTDSALQDFTTLENRASSASMHHQARMGILRAARDMGRHDLVISTSDALLASASVPGEDLPEIKFIRANSLVAKNRPTEASSLWRNLAKTPANIYGTRSAYELASLEKENGDLEQANKTITELIDANPPHAYWLARSYVLLSDILRAQGSSFEADEYLRVLRSNYPGKEADIFQMIDQRLKK